MSAINACSILMANNLAQVFGYLPHFLVVHIFSLFFLNEIIYLQINKIHFRVKTNILKFFELKMNLN